MPKKTTLVVRDNVVTFSHTSHKTGATQTVVVELRDAKEAEVMAGLKPFFHSPTETLKVLRRIDGTEKGTSFQAELHRYRDMERLKNQQAADSRVVRFDYK